MNDKYVRAHISYYNRVAGPGTGVCLFLNMIVAASLVIATIACH